MKYEHLLLQLPQKLLVFLGGLWLDELVILEPADRAADIVRERVELLAPLAGEILHRLLQRIVARLLPLAAIETFAFEALDLIELLLQLVEDPGEVVALGALLLRGAEPLEEVLHPLHAARHAPAREAGHRIFEVAAREELVGHRAEELVGLAHPALC